MHDGGLYHIQHDPHRNETEILQCPRMARTSMNSKPENDLNIDRLTYSPGAHATLVTCSPRAGSKIAPQAKVAATTAFPPTVVRERLLGFFLRMKEDLTALLKLRFAVEGSSGAATAADGDSG